MLSILHTYSTTLQFDVFVQCLWLAVLMYQLLITSESNVKLVHYTKVWHHNGYYVSENEDDGDLPCVWRA